MARLSKTQTAARREIAALCQRQLQLADFGEAIVRALSLALPNDGYRLLGIDPTTLLVNRVITASESDGWARAEWLRDVYLRAGDLFYLEIHEMMRLGLNAVAIHDDQAACWGLPPQLSTRISARDHHHYFHELRSPVGGTLFGCFASRGRWVAALQMYRRDEGRSFRPTEVAFLKLMAPMIGEGLARAIRSEITCHSACNVEIPDVAGVIILDRFGRPSFESPAAAAWRKVLDNDQAHLPGAVLAAVASARSQHGDGKVTAETAYGAIKIEAEPAGPDATSVVISRKRSASGPELPLAWDLTPAERRVAELALRGMSNAAISDQLFIGEETVRTHLRNLYEKLGIRDRTQLLARYFDATFTSINLGP